MTGDEAQAVARSLAGLSPAVLQRIVLQSGEAVLVTDADNRIVAANAAFLHLTRATRTGTSRSGESSMDTSSTTMPLTFSNRLN